VDVASFELTKSGQLTAVETADAMQRWRAGDGTFWIDVRECSKAELETMLDELDLGELIKRRLLHVGDGTSVIVLQDVAFAELAAFADHACSRRAHVATVCLENLLITLQSEPIEVSDDKQRSLDHSELGPLSTASVLCSVLFSQAARTARAARSLRDQVIALDHRMDADPGSVEPSDLAELKEDLLRAEAIGEEQEEVFQLLANAGGGTLDFSALKGPMSLLTSTASATRRLSDRLDGRFLDLRHRATEYKQDTLNVRLGFLTVISTIFLPLTLLAGVWGMNFETMPELKHPYGYPMALGLMLLVAGGVAWSLRKRGWFD
jgi:magnesium transporter